MKRKKAWLTCGIPGAGKSTWIKKNIKEGEVWCSRDTVRFSMVREDEDYFAHENEVFAAWIKEIQEAIDNPNVTGVYIDATHLNVKSRQKVLFELNLENCDVIPVNFKIEAKVAIPRNEQREGRAVVPRSVIRRMEHQFVPATLGESPLFTDIITVED